MWFSYLKNSTRSFSHNEKMLFFNRTTSNGLKEKVQTAYYGSLILHYLFPTTIHLPLSLCHEPSKLATEY